MATIRLENITKRFGPVTALDGVSFEVSDGEFFAILGPPGAGKTTTLRTIIGLERPEEGDVYMDDERVTDAIMKNTSPMVNSTWSSSVAR